MSKKDRTQPKRLKGFRDYLPEAAALRLNIMDVIRQEAALAGFQVIATPALEYAETLVGQGGDETDKQVYRFTDHGERDVALRFDLTVPLARFVAEHQGELNFPFKKLQMGEVWRGENPQKGRYREFCQCDLDIIGADSAAADAEILAVLSRILTAANCGAYTQGVGNRLLLTTLIAKILHLESPASETSALITLDKLAKITREQVEAQLAALPGADAAGATRLLDLLTSKDSLGDTDLEKVAAVISGTPEVDQEIRRVRLVLESARIATKGCKGQLRLDLTLARGLAYYTGIVFETTLDGLTGFGSVSSGGRYNDLASRFTSRELPGVGGSIGLDRLVAALEESGHVSQAAPKPVFVAVATEDSLGYAFELTSELRSHGLAADLGLVPKLGNQFKHADRLGCPFVVTVGTSERETRTYALKDMRAGTEERHLAFTGLVEKIRALRGISL